MLRIPPQPQSNNTSSVNTNIAPAINLPLIDRTLSTTILHSILLQRYIPLPFFPSSIPVLGTCSTGQQPPSAPPTTLEDSVSDEEIASSPAPSKKTDKVPLTSEKVVRGSEAPIDIQISDVAPLTIYHLELSKKKVVATKCLFGTNTKYEIDVALTKEQRAEKRKERQRVSNAISECRERLNIPATAFVRAQSDEPELYSSTKQFPSYLFIEELHLFKLKPLQKTGLKGTLARVRMQALIDILKSKSLLCSEHQGLNTTNKRKEASIESPSHIPPQKKAKSKTAIISSSSDDETTSFPLLTLTASSASTFLSTSETIPDASPLQTVAPLPALQNHNLNDTEPDAAPFSHPLSDITPAVLLETVSNTASNPYRLFSKDRGNAILDISELTSSLS